MRQIPMLFSPAMIEALLAGRKTETRRILKPQPDPGLPIGGASFIEGDEAHPLGLWVWRNGHDGSIVGDHMGHRTCPGDLIWAKETFYAAGEWVMTGETTATGKNKARFDRVPDIPILYADQVVGDGPEVEVFGTRYIKRPGLFMGKADSRLTLRVTGFNIERLHEIDEAGAVAEGVACEGLSGLQGGGELWRNYQNPPTSYTGGHADNGVFRLAKASYISLWNSINGPDAWGANPWVEATRFEVVRQNVLQVAA